MRAFVPLLLLGSLVFVAILYVGTHYPDMLGEFKSAIGQPDAMADAGSITQQQQERARLKKIDALLISDINKRDLREGRPFWGAAPTFIELAFGTTADHSGLSVQNGISYEFHQFGFGGAREAVVAEFQNGKLTCMHYATDKNTICNTGQQSYHKSAYPFIADTAASQPIPLQN